MLFRSRTPLSWAAVKRHEAVVKMLLERGDVNPDQPDTTYGATPLTWAVVNGHERIVKMLLEREDLNPNQGDTRYGQTPLFWAAERGCTNIVTLLLARNDVLTTTPDNQKQTPLSSALSNGHHEVARILRERDNPNSDATDSSGHSSLQPPARP